MKLTIPNIPLAALFLVTLSGTAIAKPKIVVTYPYIQSLVQQIAKDGVDVTVLGKGDEDPHFVVPRPSFIGKLRQADLFIINGGALEIGFVPPLIRQANNPKVVPGGEGFLQLSGCVQLIDKPEKADRAEGDVHPEGNPHFILDWHNVPALAQCITGALTRVNAAGRDAYQANLNAFLETWKTCSAGWDKQAEPFKGKKVIQYHRLFNYFTKRAGLEIVGELEPKPGIPPTSRHLEKLIMANVSNHVHMVLADAFHEKKSAEGLAQKLAVRWAVLPHDVNAVENARDIFSLYDALLGGLLK